MLLSSKNSEARQCANTNRASMSETVCKETNMNSVIKSDLNFHGIMLTPVAELPEIWLTSSQIGYALEYADDKAVQRIYSRHADEFTDQMTRVVKLTTPSGKQDSRVFSLRGAHLLAMFSRTHVAKEFRRWVLDILDRETASNIPCLKTPSEREIQAYNLDALATHYEVMYSAWKHQIYPALRAIESPLAARLYDRFGDGAIFLDMAKRRAKEQLRPGEVARCM